MSNSSNSSDPGAQGSSPSSNSPDGGVALPGGVADSTGQSGGGLGSAQANANTCFTTGPVAGVVPCTLHSITVRLALPPENCPKWWPTPGPVPYNHETYKGNLTDGEHFGLLDGSGAATFQQIPAGSCQFQFPDFYLNIEQYFKEKLGEE